MKTLVYRWLCGILLAGQALAAESGDASNALHLNLRRLVPVEPSPGQWRTVETPSDWQADKTAAIVCDMWDRHWCQGATARVAEMAPRMNQVLEKLRRRGVFIIHCPSDTMASYQQHPGRKLAQAAPKVELPAARKSWAGRADGVEPELPIYDADGGCDCEPRCPSGNPWKKQIATLEIQEGDAITDGTEAYYLMRERGITNVILMGVHENMCVLGRPFGIRQMVKLGQNVALMRDMTDTMYNSRSKPYVNHFIGTDLVTWHIEKYWCPTITSAQILGGTAFRFKADSQPPRQYSALVEFPDLSPGQKGLLKPRSTDWFIRPPTQKASVYRGQNLREVVLDNGLARRVFRLEPNGATVGLDNLMTGAGMIRSVKPEAWLTVDGKKYAVGGLTGQAQNAYLLPAWMNQLTNDPAAFHLSRWETGKTQPRLEWKRQRHAQDLPWPPPGVALHFTYESSAAELAGVKVVVHYEIYDGMPLLCKWLTVENQSGRDHKVDSFVAEILAVVEAESAVDDRPPQEWRQPLLEVFSDYAFHGMDIRTGNRTTEWITDPAYTSQVNYQLKTPALVVSRPPIGPDQLLEPGSRFETYRTFVLLYDQDERERQGLIQRRALRLLAPWCTENPIMMHVRNADTKSFRLAVDQCASTGFEMIIYTFGSGLNMESQNPDYQAKIRADVEYAHSKGIEVGGYSLFSSRSISPEHDAINPKTGKPGGMIFDNAPCLASRWGTNYLAQLRRFMEATKFDLLEHDGPYPGDICASTVHPGHRGEKDSQWVQWKMSADFYAWCRARGIYVNQPDFYFFNGGSKTGMGYRESNWSLPREQQIILGRQNIFDGTWGKTPTMGWMFVPLTEYQGGGAAATLEPLHDHLEAYAAHLLNNLGAGVQACYRGPRLYDSEETKALVIQWVAWFKKHRDILESDIIHVRRADGRDLDCLLHANPQLAEKGLAMIWNPLAETVEREIALPLYYTGLSAQATLRREDGPPETVTLKRDYSVLVKVRVPAQGATWLVFSEPQ